MVIPSPVTTFSLSDTLLVLEQKFSDVVTQDQVPEAHAAVHAFDPVVRNLKRFGDEPFFPRLVTLYWRVKFMAIPMLEEEEIVELVRDHYVDVFSLGTDYNLIDKVRGRCVGIASYDKRDAFKTRLRLGLMQSNARLTETSIQLIGSEKSGTVSNWVSDAQHVLGSESAPIAKIEEYLANGEAPRRLTSEERSRLRSLLAFVEYTKKSSRTIAGLEEHMGLLDRGGIHKVMDDSGNFVPVETPDLLELAKLAQEALGGAPTPYVVTEDVPSVIFLSPQSAISLSVPISISRKIDTSEMTMEEEGLSAELAKVPLVRRVRALADIIFEALRVASTTRVMAALRLLARANGVGTLLVQEKNAVIRQEFIENLKKKYGEAYVMAFESHPDRVQFQTAFLDWLFREKLQLSEEDADEQRKIIVTLLG